MTIPDTIQIDALALQLPGGIGPSAFGLTPPPPCPVNVNVTIELAEGIVSSCVQNDTMDALGVNYSSISKEILKLAQSPHSWNSPCDLVSSIGRIPLGLTNKIVKSAQVEIELPKASLFAQAISYSAGFDYDHVKGRNWRCTVRDLRVRTIIGLHPHERQSKQWIEVDIGIEGWEERDWDHAKVAERVHEWLEQSAFGTIEALVDRLALYVLQLPSLQSSTASVQITLRKPSALPFAIPRITINRKRADYTGLPAIPTADEASRSSATESGNWKRVFIALGSNLGDRIGHITEVMNLLETARRIKVTRTSKLYESEPMYVEDQERFINGVIELRTDLSAMELLGLLKRVEKLVGREKTFRNGPRVIDLDLLVYGQEVVQIGQEGDAEDEDGVGWLECPHPRIAEREFVLRPLADIASELVIPGIKRTVSSLLASLASSSKTTLAPIIPFPYPALPLRLDGSPKIMQIFNSTPDSFSDGSPTNLDIPTALERITKMWNVPFPPDMLDIGGMSTRPNSEPCSQEEEIARVVPLIKAIRASSDERIRTIPISIDTYQPGVVREAVHAGASCINDVRGATTPGMIDHMSGAKMPVVIMHSRGDSITMGTPELQDYEQLGGVIMGVKKELGDRVNKVLEGGVRDWNVIVDPGLGFAKNHQDNLELLRRVDEISEGHTILVGGSRKGFVGKTIGRGKDEARERGYGDAAVVAWCAGSKTRSRSSSVGAGVSGGVAILRVHDGRAMGEVLRMWRAIEGEEE